MESRHATGKLFLAFVAVLVAATFTLVHAQSAQAQTEGHHIVHVAKRYVGVPYVFGGTSLRTGLDCDAFVHRVFGKLGIWTPWIDYEQAVDGRNRRGRARPGDVVAFDEHGNGVSHVGIYAGDGYIVHASAYFGEVVVSKMKYINGYTHNPRIYR